MVTQKQTAILDKKKPPQTGVKEDFSEIAEKTGISKKERDLAGIAFVIPRRSRYCSGGQEEFVSDMEYYSILVEDHSSHYLRQDFCPTCWKQIDKSKNKIFWKSKIPPKKQIQELTNLKKEDQAMELLRDAFDKSREEENVRIFVLALYLARRKRLIFRKEIEKNGVVYFFYEVAATEEMIYVKKIDLAQSQQKIAALQNELAAQLHGPSIL